jgi:hypothetical protein
MAIFAAFKADQERNMPRTHRFNATEQKIVDLADRVIANPTATPAELTAAMRSLERVVAKAARRTKNRTPAADPVDTLVQQLEAKPAQPAEPAPADPLEAVQAIADGAVPQPTIPEPAMAFCRFCDATGHWNTWYPTDETAPKRVLLCPTCFGKMVSMDMAAAQAEARARAETPPDWAADFAGQRNMYSSDWQKSQAIWAEQDRENFDRAALERQDRERAEGQYHAARAGFLSRGGKL